MVDPPDAILRHIVLDVVIRLGDVADDAGAAAISDGEAYRGLRRVPEEGVVEGVQVEIHGGGGGVDGGEVEGDGGERGGEDAGDVEAEEVEISTRSGGEQERRVGDEGGDAVADGVVDVGREDGEHRAGVEDHAAVARGRECVRGDGELLAVHAHAHHVHRVVDAVEQRCIQQPAGGVHARAQGERRRQRGGGQQGHQADGEHVVEPHQLRRQ